MRRRSFRHMTPEDARALVVAHQHWDPGPLDDPKRVNDLNIVAPAWLPKDESWRREKA